MYPLDAVDEVRTFPVARQPLPVVSMAAPPLPPPEMSYKTTRSAKRFKRQVLLLLRGGELHLFDIDQGVTLVKYAGVSSGPFVIRPCFGGIPSFFFSFLSFLFRPTFDLSKIYLYIYILKKKKGWKNAFVACGSLDGSISIWRRKTGQLLLLIPPSTAPLPTGSRMPKGHTAGVNCVAWNPVFNQQLVSASDDFNLLFWGVSKPARKANG
jgi:WD40 repeat protein